MSSTYSSLHYHIVFSTKHRRPSIVETWRERLHAYLGGIVRSLDAFPDGVGGVEDHVHLLVGLSPNHRLSDFLRDIKKRSSVWVHDEIGDAEFYWQEGYAAFTVSPTAREDVRRYVANQVDHHRRSTFLEELVELLQRAGVEYDPRYLD
jgi:REP element-mobilizing transposase RayT